MFCNCVDLRVGYVEVWVEKGRVCVSEIKEREIVFDIKRERVCVWYQERDCVCLILRESVCV